MAREKPRRTFNKELRCKLTTEEVTERARQFGIKHKEHKELEETVKQKKREMGVTLTNSEKEMVRLADAVRDREELRPVECYDEVIRGEYLIKRVDTDEIVDRRPATPAEAQTTIPGAEASHAPPGAGILSRAAPANDGASEVNDEGDVIPSEQGEAPKAKRKSRKPPKAH